MLPRLPSPFPRRNVPAITCVEVPPTPDEKLLAELAGASLNVEERVIVTFETEVTYSSSAASRERRVRRTRRPNKEERWQKSPEPEGYGRMSAFCTADSINLEEAITALTGFSDFGERASITSYTDVVHCRFLSQPVAADPSASAPPPTVTRDAFLFPYGSAILWGFTSQQELKFLDDLQPVCEPINRSGEPTLDDELADSEFMLFELGDEAISGGGGSSSSSGGSSSGGSSSSSSGGSSSSTTTTTTSGSSSGGVVLSNNIIRLGRGDDVFEKLAISFAFAQSAKLAVFEAALEATTDEIRPIPVQLAERGRCKFTANEVARLTGRIFLERNAVNLYSNILDTPDFFWEAEAFEPLYRRVNRYLDIDDRVSILNKRLDIVNDLLDSLSTQLEIRNSHRLEIIIIVLITLEIGLEVLKESMLPPLATWPRRLLGVALLPLRAFGRPPA